MENDIPDEDLQGSN